LPSAENTKLSGTAVPKLKREIGFALPSSSDSIRMTRTDWLPFISPNDVESSFPSGEMSRSYSTSPNGNESTRFHSV